MVSGQQAARVDAYGIFLSARAAVTAAQYPSLLSYTVAISGDDGNTLRTNHYQVYNALAGGKIFVDPISEEAAAAPPKPHGINEAITFQLSWNPGAGGQTATASRPVGRPEEPTDLLGVPMLSPAYMFG